MSANPFAAAAAADSIDLRAFFHAVGYGGLPPTAAEPVDRDEVEVPVELLDDEPAKVTAAGAAVRCWVDGTQASRTVTYRARRPVLLAHVGAAAVDHHGKVHGIDEQLWVACAAIDQPWVDSVRNGIPVEVLDADEAAPDPPAMLRQRANELLGARREAAERAVTAKLVADADQRLVVCDGTVIGRPNDRRVVGVAKTVATRYLPDETQLWTLPAGWRSVRFRITNQFPGAPDRYSCYIRLVDSPLAPWSFGLLRLEAFDPELLEPLAATCLGWRQSQASGDARWDRHLAPVALVEQLLRARRPDVF